MILNISYSKQKSGTNVVLVISEDIRVENTDDKNFSWSDAYTLVKNYLESTYHLKLDFPDLDANLDNSFVLTLRQILTEKEFCSGDRILLSSSFAEHLSIRKKTTNGNPLQLIKSATIKVGTFEITKDSGIGPADVDYDVVSMLND